MKISVIVPTINASPTIRQCLQPSVCQANEIIVVDASTDDTAALVRKSFPTARLLQCPSGTAIEMLRYRGLLEARGDIVALTEQYALPPADWLEQILRAAECGVDVGGGPVAPNPDADLFGWALYFARYYRFLPPLPQPPVTDFSALNVFYRRSLLDRYLREMQGRFAETFFHRLLRANGYVLTTVPNAVVTSLERASFREFALNRYRSGRSFGSECAVPLGRFRRMAGVARSVLLPALFWLRCAAAVLSRRRYISSFLLCSPVLLCYFAFWACGEAVGLASGRE